jgi:hypothetical protein
MTEDAFISLAVSDFSPGSVYVVSGKNPYLTNDLLCRTKTALAGASKNALVMDADTFVGYPLDVFIGGQFWQPRYLYRKGEYVFPTSYVDDGVLYNIPFDCAATILPRFRYACTMNGMSGDDEPVWSLVEDTRIPDNQTIWLTTAIRVDGLTWEMILLNSRKGDGFVVLAHNEFDPNGPRAITGNLTNDVVLDLEHGFGPGGNVLKHKAYPSRDIFPYLSMIFYHENEDVTFIKTQTPVR